MTRCSSCFAAKDKEGTCAYCGYDEQTKEVYPNALAPGTVLNRQYLIGKVLGQGGFGITYLGLDLHLDIKVAIKEYYPDGLVTRGTASTQLTIYSGEKEQYFQYGADRFLEEAKILGKLQNTPNIVPVKAFFKENNTAYLVMDYIEGISFKQYLKKMNGKILYADAILLLAPIMEALEEVHKTGLLHRDISPDNIYITHKGESKLLDFGAARYTLGEHSKSLSVILKPGYAPEEQYRTKGKQGPWTDVYALAATLYNAITGQLPPDALDRLDLDEIKRPSELGVLIPRQSEAALMKALAVRASTRYQTVDEFRKGLLAVEAAENVSDTKEGKIQEKPAELKVVSQQQVIQQVNTTQTSGFREPQRMEMQQPLPNGYNSLQPNWSQHPNMRPIYPPPKKASKLGVWIAVFASTFAIGMFALFVTMGIRFLSSPTEDSKTALEELGMPKETKVIENNPANRKTDDVPIAKEKPSTAETKKAVHWQYVIAPSWQAVQDFSGGLAAVYDGQSWGYIDVTGRLVIGHEFEDVKEFSDGIGMAKQGGLWGSIDQSGMWIIYPWWDDVGFFNMGYREGLLSVCQDDLWMFVDEEGYVVLEDERCYWAQPFSENLALVVIEGKCGYIDKDGTFVIPPKWDSGWYFSEGLAPVQSGLQWGYIDTSGSMVIEPKYNFAIPFTEGLAAVDVGSNEKAQVGFINKYGEMVIEPKYQDAYDFREGLSAVRVNGKYGFINQKGEMVIEPRWEEARSISEGLAAVKENGLWGYIEITQP